MKNASQKTARPGGAGNVSAKGIAQTRRRPAASPWREDKEARNNIIAYWANTLTSLRAD